MNFHHAEIKNRRNALSRLAGITLLISAFSVFLSVGTVRAQIWKVYAEQVKAELAEEKRQGREKSPPPAPLSVDSSAEGAALPSAAPDFAEPSAEPRSEPAPPNELPQAEPSRVASRTPSPSSQERRSLLDFSDALGDDASAVYAVEGTEQAPSAPRVNAPPLPSYRNPPRMRNDAAISDVFFLNPKRGWAVGDRGAIWTTFNGGSTWMLVDAPVDHNLFGVHFFDENFGVAVGGEALPGGRNGRGTILRTTDGGATWSEVEHAGFPILRNVRVYDPQNILVGGDSSELYPSGIFQSADSGLTWTAKTGLNRHEGWKRLAYNPLDSTGFGIAPGGTFQSISGKSVTPSPLFDASTRLADLSQTDANSPLWLVGDRGLIRCSDDGGASWRRSPGNLPSGAGESFDFRTVHASKERVRVAGSPGSQIFLSEDGGKNWRSAPTGVSVPLRKIRFVDDLHGWGVGELGVIVATTDGGRSWTVQHEGGRRLALLGLFSDGTDFSPELIARLGGEEGYLCATAALVRPAERECARDEIPWLLRLGEATVEAGGCAAEQPSFFRLAPKTIDGSLEKMLERFDRENDGRGLERLREYLVRLIRTWRPSVIVIGDPALGVEAKTVLLAGNDSRSGSTGGAGEIENSENGAEAAKGPISPVAYAGIDPRKLAMIAEHSRKLDSGPKDPLRALIERELPRAIRDAADPLRWPEHRTVCGLGVWPVEKVQMIRSGATGGNIEISAGDYCASLGRSVGEIADRASSILGVNPDARRGVEGRISLATLYDRNAEETKFPTVFAQLDLPPGGEARRFSGPVSGDADALAGRNVERRKLLGLVETLAARSPETRGTEILLSQLADEIQRLDPDLAVDYLWTIAKRFIESGDWPHAEEVCSMIAINYPNHPGAREAILWLMQFYVGSEPFWRTQDKNRFHSVEGEYMQAGLAVRQATTGTAVDPSQTGSRFQNAGDLGQMIRRLHPELYMDPAVRFPLAVAQRRRGFDNDALRYFLNRSLVSGDDLWGVRARAEFWLLAPNREDLSDEQRICPLSTCGCRTTAARPYLDGELEPEVWQKAEKFSLSAKRPAMPIFEEDPRKKLLGQWREENEKLTRELGTFVSLLYDRDFLYLGIECRKTDGFKYSSDALKETRRRDANLDDQDRVEIVFDLDRDYATGYRFVFDWRGWADDVCWNRADWNGRLFIARKETETSWTLEAAIPWEELAERPPTAEAVWCVALRRLVPNVGMECWNADNSVAGENGFGFLFFGNR